MKKYLLSLILLLIAVVSPLFAQSNLAKVQITSTDSTIYTCPMHPGIISDKPGKCPKCGMDLIQKNPSSTHKMDMMMCPMHGMVNMDHKHDKKKDNKRVMKGMGIAMGVMMVVMIIVISSD